MKTKLLIATTLIFLFSMSFSIGQTRTDYDVQTVTTWAAHELTGMSATYWNDRSWCFYLDHTSANYYELFYSPLTIDDNGYISEQCPIFNMDLLFPQYLVPHITSCVFEGQLWSFWYNF